jgi:hypothetical protein
MVVENALFALRSHSTYVVRDNSIGYATAIQGDIDNAFPSMDNDILIKELETKIQTNDFVVQTFHQPYPK